MLNNDFFNAYENRQLLNCGADGDRLNWVAYDELPQSDARGVLKADTYRNGKLMQAYSKEENHTLVVAATRLGKTTSYVIPAIISNARRKLKRSMVISDPKGELYRITSQTLRDEGYRVILLNFRDYMHSECWNVLTPIYRKYQHAISLRDQVEAVDTPKGPRNKFRGKIYSKRSELERDIDMYERMELESVSKDIDDLAAMLIVTHRTDDPYWEDSARGVLKSFIWALLEDSNEELLNERDECDFQKQLITEDTFSFRTIFSIYSGFRDSNESRYDDGGFFTKRKPDSRAYLLAKNNFIENAPNTRKCIMSSFDSKMSIFRDSTISQITSCNSFDFDSLVDGPVAVFIDYRDEIKAHYQVISLFVQNMYKMLIERANNLPGGKLPVPFYFMLDEFGNFPALRDFDTTISACAGRNIYFTLVIQSYAQLNNVYGKDVAEIILDNLNVKIFLGSNNYDTLQQFSRECGEMTRISPLSALNGSGSEIEHYELETIPLITRSRLSCFEPGECVVLEANCDHVLFSRLERYYLCPELSSLSTASEHEYTCSVNPLDERYLFTLKKRSSRNALWE